MSRIARIFLPVITALTSEAALAGPLEMAIAEAGRTDCSRVALTILQIQAENKEREAYLAQYNPLAAGRDQYVLLKYNDEPPRPKDIAEFNQYIRAAKGKALLCYHSLAALPSAPPLREDAERAYYRLTGLTAAQLQALDISVAVPGFKPAGGQIDLVVVKRPKPYVESLIFSLTQPISTGQMKIKSAQYEQRFNRLSDGPVVPQHRTIAIVVKLPLQTASQSIDEQYSNARVVR